MCFHGNPYMHYKWQGYILLEADIQSNSETQFGIFQTAMVESFCKNYYRLNVVHYFRKKLHHRHFTGFLMRFLCYRQHDNLLTAIYSC